MLSNKKSMRVCKHCAVSVQCTLRTRMWLHELTQKIYFLFYEIVGSWNMEGLFNYLLNSEHTSMQLISNLRSSKPNGINREEHYGHLIFAEASFTSEPRLLNLILINLIVRWPSECIHYINHLWNATFGLWKIRIMNGWMVSFEWKTRKHHKNRELVATLWFNFESFRR